MVIEELNHVEHEEILGLLPPNLKRGFSKELTDQINQLIDGDEILRQTYRDNVLGYMTVLREGKFKLTSYLNAVRFCSYRISGLGVTESYRRTFTGKVEAMEQQGASSKYISSVTTQYNRSKLVELIMKQAMTPVYIMNMDAFQEAVNTQLDVMRNSESDMARTTAANSLLTHLKPPEATKIEMNLEVSSGKGMMEELRDVTNALAAKQLENIQKGIQNAKEVAHADILEIKDVE